MYSYKDEEGEDMSANDEILVNALIDINSGDFHDAWVVAVDGEELKIMGGHPLELAAAVTAALIEGLEADEDDIRLS